jgi:hypothetical protein
MTDFPVNKTRGRNGGTFVVKELGNPVFKTPILETTGNPVIRRPGRNGGTFVVEELVRSYPEIRISRRSLLVGAWAPSWWRSRERPYLNLGNPRVS